MSLSTESREKINRAWAHCIKEDEVDQSDLNAVIECLYDHWEIMTDETATNNYVDERDIAEKVVILTKINEQKAELEAEGIVAE